MDSSFNKFPIWLKSCSNNRPYVCLPLESFEVAAAAAAAAYWKGKRSAMPSWLMGLEVVVGVALCPKSCEGWREGWGERKRSLL